MNCGIPWSWEELVFAFQTEYFSHNQEGTKRAPGHIHPGHFLGAMPQACRSSALPQGTQAGRARLESGLAAASLRQRLDSGETWSDDHQEWTGPSRHVGAIGSWYLPCNIFNKISAQVRHGFLSLSVFCKGECLTNQRDFGSESSDYEVAKLCSLSLAPMTLLNDFSRQQTENGQLGSMH